MVEKAHEASVPVPRPVVGLASSPASPSSPFPLAADATSARARPLLRRPDAHAASDPPLSRLRRVPGAPLDLTVTGTGARPAARLDPAKRLSDRASLAARVQALDGELDRARVLACVDEFLEAAGGGSAAESAARTALRAALELLRPHYLRQAAGFTSADVAAASNAHRIVLWSKLNKFRAQQRAVDTDGVSLESSAVGTLFDGLDFGIPSGHWAGKLQWTLVSQGFVREGTSGSAAPDVHALVFRGIDPSSVFTTREWPFIRHCLHTGTIAKLVVHVYELGPDGAGLVEPRAPYEVRSAADWNTLPKVAPTASAKAQQRQAHLGEAHAAAARASAAGPGVPATAPDIERALDQAATTLT